jgi:hypothetical protein
MEQGQNTLGLGGKAVFSSSAGITRIRFKGYNLSRPFRTAPLFVDVRIEE